MDWNIFKWVIIIWIGIFIFAIFNDVFNGDGIYRKKTRIFIEIELRKINNMNGYEFEEYCAGLLRRIGYKNVNTTPLSNDGGRDIECYNLKGEKVFVECKHYKNKPINREQVLKLLGSASHYGGDNCKALFITTSSYNKNAIKMRSNKKLELWDKADIIRILKQLS